MGNVLNDKELIKAYLKHKGISKNYFCSSLGFSHAFLDSGKTLSVENLRAILEHEEYDDFNLEAFIKKQPGELLKPQGQLSENVVNHSFIYETMEELPSLQQDNAGEAERKRLVELLKLALRKLSTLSEDYTKLYSYLSKDANKKNSEKA